VSPHTAKWKGIAMTFNTTEPEYVEQAMRLSRKDAKHIPGRLRAKIACRLQLERNAPPEAVKDEQLKEWRENLDALRRRCKDHQTT
jgi:hypothetical protein